MEQREMWLGKGKALFSQLRDKFTAIPTVVEPSVWYSGLGIEPAEFSEQLARLQVSLSYANGAGANATAVSQVSPRRVA